MTPANPNPWTMVPMPHTDPAFSLFSNATDNLFLMEALYLINQDACILLVNDEACRSLGYTRDELQGMTVTDIAPDFPAARWQTHWLQLRQQRSLRFETRHTNKQGHTFPVEVHGNYFELDGQGYTLALTRDISARKQIEAEPCSSEEKYRTIFEESFDCLLILSPAGRILDINKRGAALFGYDNKKEIKGLDFSRDLCAKSTDRDQVLAMINAQDSAEFEVEFKKKNGETMSGLCMLTAMHDAKRIVTSYRGIVHDLTAQKRAELERQAHLRFLEGINLANKVMQGTTDFRRMTANVLDLMLDLFACDRASLLYPCAPEAKSWRIPVERTLPSYGGGQSPGHDFPLTEEMAMVMRAVLVADGPLTFAPGALQHLPPPLTDGDDTRPRIALALSPDTGHPWLLCLHRESAAPWSSHDALLLHEIGRRLTDGLTRLQAYRELSRDAERFRLLTTNSPDTIASLDQDLVYTWVCNAQGLFGRTEIIGKSDRELLPPYEAQRLTESEQRVLDSGKSQRLELTSLASGRPRWFELFLHPTQEHGGKVSGVCYYAHDITDRKVTETLLRQREREFRSLADNLPVNLSRFNWSGRILYVNKAFAEHYGMAPDELIGKTPMEVAPDKNMIAFQQMLGQVMANGARQEMELAGPRQDEVHLIRISPELDETGRVIGALAIGQDITESRLTQTRLEEQAAQLEENNDALKVLLAHGRRAETEIQEKCLTNIEVLILPYLTQLGKMTGNHAESRHCLEMIRRNLRGLATSNMGKLSSPIIGLSQREIRVADLIRADHATKEIAAILGITPGTVEFYRDRIREKLGLKKKKANLKNYLRTHFSE